MLLNLVVSLTLTSFIGGLEGDVENRKAAKAIISSEVERLVSEERKTNLAPPIWFQCINEARSSRVLEREVLRIYREEEQARMMTPEELVKWAADEVCEDTYYEN